MAGISLLEQIYPVPRAFFWDCLDDFGNLAELMPEAVERVEVDGQGPGARRRIFLRNPSGPPGEVVERYDGGIRHELFVLSIEGQGALPLRDYVATVRLEDAGDQATRVTWQGRWNPAGASASEVKALLEGLYSTLCARIAQRYTTTRDGR